MAGDKRIPELDPLAIVNGNQMLAAYDPSTDTTYRINVSQIQPAAEDEDFVWEDSPAVYQIDDVVVWEDKFWISLVADNEGNIPQEDANWHEVSKSESGLVFWVAGIYTGSVVTVLYNLDQFGYKFPHLFQLVDATRPFNSVNLENEFMEGKWKLVSAKNYYSLFKAAHGFAIGNWLTIKAGNWNKCNVNETGLGRVVNINGNWVLLELRTQLISGAFVPFTKYYLGDAGIMTSTSNGNPVAVGVTATLAIIWPQSMNPDAIVLCGYWNASGGDFPDSGGTGLGGEPSKGNVWIVGPPGSGAAGTLEDHYGNPLDVVEGARLMAMDYHPGNDGSKWNINQ